MGQELRIGGGARRKVQADRRLSEPGAFIRGLEAATRCVCVVEREDGEGGTGLLIGPDLVLTNHHVAMEGDVLAAVRCRFDFTHAEEGAGALNGTKPAGVHDVILSDPPSDADREGLAEGFGDSVDIAVLQLDHRIGEEPDAFGEPRGWIALPHAPPEPEERDIVLLLQHPQGADPAAGQQPLLNGMGLIDRVLDDGRRVSHTSLSNPGSSGGPLFAPNKGFALLALHNAGGKDGGQGIPAARIAEFILRCHADKNERYGILSSDTAEAPAYGNIRMDAIGRRRDVAQWLMARQGEEQRLLRLRVKASNAGLPLVHVVVSRPSDEFGWFQSRMGRFSLVATSAQLPGLHRTALLNGVDGPAWNLASLEWPRADVPHKYRVSAALTDLSEHAAGGDNHLVVFSCDAGAGLSARSERKLLEAVALGAVRDRSIDAGRVQVVVNYRTADGAGVLAQELGRLWIDIAERPGHCGLCALLPDVRLQDLEAWRAALEGAWNRLPDSFGHALRQAFPNDATVPLAHVAERIRLPLEKLIAEGLDRAGRRQGG